MKKTVLGALLMAAAMMVLPVSQADAGFKLPGVKINLPGNNKGPLPQRRPRLQIQFPENSLGRMARR